MNPSVQVFHNVVHYRAYWIVSLLFACFVAGIMIQPIHYKWKNTPVVTSVDDTNFPIWKIDFPAVTICSNNKIVERQLQSLLLLEPWKNLTESIGESYESFVCKRALVKYQSQSEVIKEMLQFHTSKKKKLNFENLNF